MIRDALAAKVATAVQNLHHAGKLPSDSLGAIEIADTKQPEHGDYACNLAMTGAKAAGMNPRALGELLAHELENDKDFQSVEVAGPGFINLRLTPKFLSGFIPKITSTSSLHPEPTPATPNQKINVEFVSVNPNGPITIGSGRGAAYGSTLCNVLEAAGHTVHREYYINDGVNSEQMRQFAESVRGSLMGQNISERAYKGDYVDAVADQIRNLTDIRPANEESAAELAAISMLVTRYGRLDLWRNLTSGGDGVFLQGGGWSSSITNAVPEEFGPDFAARFHQRVVDNLRKELGGANFEFQVEEVVPKNPKHAVNYQLTIPGFMAIGDDWLRVQSQNLMLAAQREALSAFGVEFDTWFSEQSLHDSGLVAEEVEALEASGVADTAPHRFKLKLAKGGKIEDVEVETQATDEEDTSAGEGAGDTLWLRSTKFGDDMDRVLRRRDGRLTYIASDVAYHKDKFNRPTNADKLITVLGPDHHGYIGRLTAVVAAMLKAEGQVSFAPSVPSVPLSETDAILYTSSEERDACHAALAVAKNKLEVQIFQLVRFLKDGKPAPMRKRDGNIFALIDLINEIGERMRPDGTQEEKQQAGTDVARFFYLMRSHDTTFDFDLNLAETKSDENPVFYVQYAHARICSILAKAEAENHKPTPGIYTDTPELSLIKKIADLPVEIRRCADDYGVHRLVTYSIELARAFHHFYNECRVINPEDPATSAHRLALCQATQYALKASLDLLGVSAPEKM